MSFVLPTKQNLEQVKKNLESQIQEKKQKILVKWINQQFKQKFEEKYKNLLKETLKKVIPGIIQKQIQSISWATIFSILVSDIPFSMNNFKSLVDNMLKPFEDKNLEKLNKDILDYLKTSESKDVDQEVLKEILPLLRTYSLLSVITEVLYQERVTLEVKHYLKFCKNKEELATVLDLIGKFSHKQDENLLKEMNKFEKNALIQYHLGMYYRRLNNPKGLELLEESAKIGFAPAQSWLGTLYISGNEVKKDVEKGKILLEKAAEIGECLAQYHLGVLYGKGVDIPKNYQKAMFWYQKAIDNTEFTSGNEQIKQLAKDNLEVIENNIDFDVEFETIQENIKQLSEKDQKEMAEELKKNGNEFFNNGSYNNALKYYMAALNYDQENFIICSNISLTFFKIGNYKDSLQLAEKCIKLNDKHSKGYYRKAVCLEEMERFGEAKDAYLKALELDKDNLEIKERLEKLNEKSKLTTSKLLFM